MSEVIVVTSGKGGVGKTTTSASLGAGLAMHGKKVCIIDADIGLRNLDVVMGLENRIIYDLINVIEGSCRLRQALIRDKRFEGLFLLPAAQTRDKDCINPSQMAKLCESLKENEFEYIIIDSPAGIEQGFKNAIAGANSAIVVTTPEVSAVRDADRIIGMLAANGIEKPKLILNRIRPHMVKMNQMMSIDDVNDILAIDILGIIPDDEDIIISSNKGIPIIADESSAAATAYKNIVRRLLGEEVPFMEMDTRVEEVHQKTFIERIKNLFSK